VKKGIFEGQKDALSQKFAIFWWQAPGSLTRRDTHSWPSLQTKCYSHPTAVNDESTRNANDKNDRPPGVPALQLQHRQRLPMRMAHIQERKRVEYGDQESWWTCWQLDWRRQYINSAYSGISFNTSISASITTNRQALASASPAADLPGTCKAAFTRHLRKLSISFDCSSSVPLTPFPACHPSHRFHFSFFQPSHPLILSSANSSLPIHSPSELPRRARAFLLVS